MPDRDARPALSSAVARRVGGKLVLASVLLASAAAATLTDEQRDWYGAQLGVPDVQVPAAIPAPDPLAEAVMQWRRLRQGGAGFSELAGFLIVHRGWPGEMQLRRQAERALDLTSYSPPETVNFFALFPPLGAAAQAKQAEALAAMGRMPEATVAARAAWARGLVGVNEEARLLGRFAGQLTPEDHDRRMDALLWNRATDAAVRQVAWVPALRRPIYQARLAFQQRLADADMQAVALGVADLPDPGLVADHALWLRDMSRVFEARSFLAQPRRFAAPPSDPEHWMEALLTVARGAAGDNQWSLVYPIAAQADLAYPAGTAVRDRSLSERDDYTSLMWLAGTAAMKIGRPADAAVQFERYAAAARSPQTQSKGQYWTGRAARAAGDAASADRLFAAAAQFTDQFYGQLSAERVGVALAPPPPVPMLAIAPADRARFDASEPVRAARLLGRIGDWQDQSLFVRGIAQSVSTDTDHVLTHQLARELGRPDLGVMVARAARLNGSSDYVRSGFPEVAVPGPVQGSWTMIHAISRQESQFDRQALSPAGARGMMQLMVPTAREQAGQLGLDFDPVRLSDPSYNVQLGAAYFSRLMDRYGGNYVLAVAAYNAGPGNVNRFIAANGDPRAPGADVVQWIEQIPLAETRGYVQRVLENAVVYDLLNPNRATMPSSNRLSAYLGKSVPG